ncbi:mannosyl-3-phosphoglycerate synthase [Thermococcus thioreducens]|uniref:Mannosyl-3-phosphoglycerate synthase n=1 Tax=Thermococcus thioreducens TaxID=277988 RepID=A0A0Q2M4E2_9EURY|nr:mannosyl-3-phosphoglycerate synthase [Thermococcus thioreducens]ASJ11963.1 mannosyl-3-phosphoglycerate synthase [Thermococcus thioreducens]KQH82810.1 mannosyl-3-phosphoglycerate synthase [Thermococcus thioreducens]SEW10893.1 mannosyl-3-phosphoglycerate synthase [Thermococcus thioreducens]
MLLEAPVYKELFGAVEIYEVQKVIKLDTQTRDVGSFTVTNVPREDIYGILEDMAIVVPMKNEKLQLVDGVLKAIPHQCPIIIVSNSKREGPNLFKQEVDLVKHFYNLTRSRIIMIHQKDSGIAEAFREAGYTEVLDEKGAVRSGKGEGMLIGILIAKAVGAKYVGFVDADNYIPGSVNEYVKDYAAGFLMSESEYAMVRLSWRHKPKVSTKGLYFKKWGRVSEITNKYMNALFGVATNFETNIIVTGNAGEHAMTLKLAEIMPFSTGYSIEPFELVYLFETFGRWGRDPHTDVYDQGVEVFQIETLNPHLHEDKGKEHVRDMILSSLGTIYHSELATEGLRRRILQELRLHGLIGENEEPPKPRTMPPIENINANQWMKILEDNAETLLRFEV